MAVEVQIGMALDVAGEEVVGPEKVEMVMNVSNGMPCFMLPVLQTTSPPSQAVQEFNNEFKREGAGRGNWGTPTDEVPLEPEEPVVEVEKNEELEKPAAEEDGVDATKENPASEAEEKEPEEKEMTLEEYEKVLEEKRKALQALKSVERKVGLDTELAKMQLLSSKKTEEEIFVKLGSEKEKRKDAAEKEEKARKSLSINEFLKPAEGERNYSGERG